MLTMEDAGSARNLIQRLYTFRKRLMEEAPEIAKDFQLVDLRVHDEAGNIIVGRTTRVPGKAIIRVFVPTWKDQIRKQLDSSLEGDKEIQTPQDEQLPVLPGLSLEQPVVLVSEENPDNLSEALSNAGYATGNAGK